MVNGVRENIEELVDFAESELNFHEYFDYHQWDGSIENEEMTDEELDYLRENYQVVVTLVPKA